MGHFRMVNFRPDDIYFISVMINPVVDKTDHKVIALMMVSEFAMSELESDQCMTNVY